MRLSSSVLPRWSSAVEGHRAVIVFCDQLLLFECPINTQQTLLALNPRIARESVKGPVTPLGIDLGLAHGFETHRFVYRNLSHEEM